MNARTSLHLVASALAVVVASACQGGGGKAGSSGGPKPAETAAPTGSAVIQGTVSFVGTVPPPEAWGGANNADCRSKHEATIQLVKVKEGKLEDAFVYVKEGLPPGGYDPPSTPAPLNQKNCEFEPRVFGVVAGGDIEAGNADPFMHNVKSSEFNQGFPSAGVKRTVKLNEEKVMSVIQCDVHPWMRAYAGVMHHPYFAVTKADGSFKISGLVDGTYSVAVWHEKLGTSDVTGVKTTAATPGTVELKLSAK